MNLGYFLLMVWDEPSRTAATLTFDAVGKTAPPQNITGLTYEPLTDKLARLRWTPPTEADVIAGRKNIYTPHTRYHRKWYFFKCN